jgi:divalent metal cation (Fe/Co/Zn/Cd) transporter
VGKPVQNLWIKKVTKEFKNKTHWAKLRVKKDNGQDYIDVLIGRKGQKWHTHLGINLDQTIRFAEFRKITRSIERTVTSLKKGLMDRKELIVDKNVKGKKRLILKLDMNGMKAGEVTIKEFMLE